MKYVPLKTAGFMFYKKNIIYTVIGYFIITTTCFAGFYYWRSIKSLRLKKIPVNMQALHDKENIIPVAVIGSGPAGLSAALYAARGHYHTIIFEGRQPGGQLTTTSWVENWPGIPKILGADAIATLKKQAQEFGAIPVAASIQEVDFSTWPFKLITDDGITVYALTIIIATGANPRKLDKPGEDEFWGKGVTTCAICDAPFYKDSEVVVVGGGDSAVEEALQLAGYARKITILVRGSSMRASATMQAKLKDYSHIHVMYNVQITAIKGDEQHVHSIDLTVDGQVQTMPIDGVFLAIGHEPNTEVFKNYLNLDANNYILVTDHTQQASIEGIFAAGDVSDHRYRQAGVASGDGIKAALDASEFLRTHNFTDAISEHLKNNFYNPRAHITAIKMPKITNQTEYKKEVVESPIPVFVDFYTDYCPSCLQMIPVIEAVAGNFVGKMKFVKVNALEFQELAEELVVPTVPTFLVFKDGKMVARVNEIMNKKEFTDFISRFI